MVEAFHCPTVSVPTCDRLVRAETALVINVPLVGKVIVVAPVVVRVSELAPDVASVEPLASVNVPVVVETVRPFKDVAVATPRVGVVNVGPAESASCVPVPVVV